MPYVRIWVHLIWSTKGRRPLLNEALREKVFSHMKGNAAKKEIYLDSINGIADHVHTLVSLKSDQTIAKVAQLLKGESSHWINAQNLCNNKFEWQDEYIAVSVSESNVDNIRQYIRNQVEHHRVKSFNEEYEHFLLDYGFLVKG